MKVYEQLIKILKDKGAGYLVLLDPDNQKLDNLASIAKALQANGVDGILIGGSLLMTNHFDEFVKIIKDTVSIPVILFPGNGSQLSGNADAVLFMSLISGRNSNFLIDEQVRSAPVVKSLGLEAISTGYMLVESGSITSIEFISNTKPLPRTKPEIAAAHGIAAEYLGMKLLYLEAGSGAEKPVPDNMIKAVCRSVSLPLIVGGGITNPEIALNKVRAGASFIVTGNVIEKENDFSLIRRFSDAVHH